MQFWIHFVSLHVLIYVLGIILNPLNASTEKLSNEAKLKKTRMEKG